MIGGGDLLAAKEALLRVDHHGQEVAAQRGTRHRKQRVGGGVACGACRKGGVVWWVGRVRASVVSVCVCVSAYRDRRGGA